MNQQSLQQLLEKYREGTLTSEERASLEVMTHKDEVMEAAEGKAARIVRGRIVRVCIMSVVGLAVMGVGLMSLQPRQMAPMVASVEEPVVVTSEEMEPANEDIVEIALHEDQPQLLASAQPVSPSKRTTARVRMKSDEPVVMCNSQCNADSVINDIKRFLSV